VDVPAQEISEKRSLDHSSRRSVVSVDPRALDLPGLSTDIYRYIRDGRVQGAGINPYLHLPVDSQLAGLAINLWLGLYRSPAEWPWTYFFLIVVQIMLVVQRPGRSLGLDAITLRHEQESSDRVYGIA
jgi:hypothetical protein